MGKEKHEGDCEQHGQRKLREVARHGDEPQRPRRKRKAAHA